MTAMGTRRIQVRLARGPSRLPLRMRLDIDRWPASATVAELIPCCQTDEYPYANYC
jgi:hypothetical protein